MHSLNYSNTTLSKGEQVKVLLERLIELLRRGARSEEHTVRICKILLSTHLKSQA